MLTFDLVEFCRQQATWSLETFGPDQHGQVDHIRKELIEIEADPGDLKEWIDVVTLALDGAWRAGHSPEDIAAQLGATLRRNQARTWPDYRTMDPSKAIEHVRDEPPAPGPKPYHVGRLVR